MTPAEAEWLLAECRRKIDALDLQLRDVLNQRAVIVKEVVRAKESLGMPVYEGRREQDVVRKVAEGNLGPLGDDALTHIFEIIMGEMRALQEVYLHKQGNAGE